MKCPNCLAEWQLPEQSNTSLETCPFCGGSLRMEPVTMDTIDGVLEEMIRRFGVDILRNGPRMVAVFTDLAPQLRKERILLTYLIQSDGNRKLLDAVQMPSSRQRAEYQRVVQHLTEERFIARNAAENICCCFLKAVGVTITEEPVEPEKKPKTATPPAQKPVGPAKTTTASTPTPKTTTSSSSNAPKPASAKPSQTGGISNYQQYMKALEQLYLDKGKRPLTDEEIDGFIAKHQLYSRFRISLWDVKKDLTDIYSRFPSSPSSQTPKSASVKPSKPERISNYQQYMEALEQLYLDKGKRPLTDEEINNFIAKHQLYRRFKITPWDVSKDLSDIYSNAVGKNAPGKSLSKFTTYEAYMDALEKAYIDNGKRELSGKQIDAFLKQHMLDKRFKINAEDVRADLQTIAQKQKKQKEQTTLSGFLSRLFGKK